MLLLLSPKYLESPFTRYVSRPLSSGVLSDSVRNFAPEDRSKMGTPSIPSGFGMICGLLRMRLISSWMPRPTGSLLDSMLVGRKLSKGLKRETYIDNEAQPQKSSAPAPYCTRVH